MYKNLKKKNSENGGAGLNLLIIGVVLFLAGNAGYQYIPTAYNGESIKQEMQAAVLQGMALPPSAGDPVKVTKARIEKLIRSNDAPADAFVEVKLTKKAIQARVAYTQQVGLIPFGIYNYQYDFDYTASPTGFLTDN